MYEYLVEMDDGRDDPNNFAFQRGGSCLMMWWGTKTREDIEKSQQESKRNVRSGKTHNQAT
jgi:hypothetical protein